MIEVELIAMKKLLVDLNGKNVTAIDAFSVNKHAVLYLL